MCREDATRHLATNVKSQVSLLRPFVDAAVQDVHENARVLMNLRLEFELHRPVHS